MNHNLAHNKLGLPLDAPVTQTIIPVLAGPEYNNVVGFFSIASTTFNGSETTFTMPEGTVPIKSVTLPDLVGSGVRPGKSYERTRVQQYMAAVWDSAEAYARPWIGFSAWVDAGNDITIMKWFMPTIGQGHKLYLSPMVKDLTYAMNFDSYTPPSTTPPSVTPGALEWATSMVTSDLAAACAFFDFNWVELFKAQSTRSPLRLEVVSNPASGEFKSTLVPYPVVDPMGHIEFNSVRIIKLKPVDPGTYVFNYKVFDDLGQSTAVTFTLTVL